MLIFSIPPAFKFSHSLWQSSWNFCLLFNLVLRWYFFCIPSQSNCFTKPLSVWIAQLGCMEPAHSCGKKKKNNKKLQCEPILRTTWQVAQVLVCVIVVDMTYGDLMEAMYTTFTHCWVMVSNSLASPSIPCPFLCKSVMTTALVKRWFSNPATLVPTWTKEF